MSKKLKGIAIILFIVVLIYRPNSNVEISIILGIASLAYLLLPNDKEGADHVV